MSVDEFDPDAEVDEYLWVLADRRRRVRPAAPVVWCWSCDEFHDPPQCLTTGSELTAVTVTPPWHRRERARRLTYGFFSDHEWAKTVWPVSDRFL